MPDDADGLLKRAAVARRENRPDDSHRDLVQAVALCRQSGRRRELVQALKALGQIERDLGNREAALPLYEEAVALCRKDDDLLALAHTVRHLGDIHREAGRADLAEPCLLEALAIYRGHARTERLDLANAIRPLAILRDESGDVDEARRLWTEARDLYAKVGVEVGAVECARRLARPG